MATFISLIEAADLIAAVGPSRTVLLIGENGIGKTSIMTPLLRMPALAHYHAPTPPDCTQLSEGDVGLPDLDRERGVSTMLPNERFGVSRTNQRGVQGARPVLLMLDEIGKAPRYIKNMLSPIFYERRLGAFHFPEGSIVIATTNLAAEGLGDAFEAHTANRLIKIYVRKPTYAEWRAWATARGDINEIVLATLHEMPQIFDSFLDYEKGGKYEREKIEEHNPYIFNPKVQQDAYVSPRSLHAASDILNNVGACTDATVQAALEGAVGAPFAAQLAARRRFGKQVPDLKDIFANPATVPVPENPAACMMAVFKIINQVRNGTEADAAMTYIQRMREEMQQIFFFTLDGNAEAIMRFVASPQFAPFNIRIRKFF